MKSRPIIFSGPMVKAINEGRKSQTRRVIKNVPHILTTGKALPELVTAYKSAWLNNCPYGVPGDRLWVKETWFSPEYASTGQIPADPGCVHYRADGDTVCWDGPWRPSIHMPRWASRLTLELTDVRVERLQEIGTDATAEGFAMIEDFVMYWDSLNGKRGYDWDANPWVWVREFKRIEGEATR